VGAVVGAAGIGVRLGTAHAYREGNLSCVDLLAPCFWIDVAAIPLPLVGSAMIAYDAYRLGEVRARRAGAAATPLSTLHKVRAAAVVVGALSVVVDVAAFAWAAYRAVRCGPDSVRTSSACLGDTAWNGMIVQAVAEAFTILSVPTVAYTLGYEKARPKPPPFILSPIALRAGGGLSLALRF